VRPDWHLEHFVDLLGEGEAGEERDQHDDQRAQNPAPQLVEVLEQRHPREFFFLLPGVPPGRPGLG